MARHRNDQENGALATLLGMLIVLLALTAGLWGWSRLLSVDLGLVSQLDELLPSQVLQVLGQREARTEAAGVVAVAEPEPAAIPYCAPGTQPAFVLGFADLKRQVGAPMGEPLECEHTNPENGDALQQTSTGLAMYRKSTNMPMFTDGWRHWALTPDGLVTWEGEAVDPPADARLVEETPGA